jgi:hypothetical protein
MQSEARNIEATIAHMVARGASAQQMADAAVLVWRAVQGALAPIIGERGFAALYKRSVYLRRTSDPWLSAAHEGLSLPCDFAALHTALAQQSSANAAAAHSALLLAFCDLLATLIGAPLTERLLKPVWEKISSGIAAQDNTP